MVSERFMSPSKACGMSIGAFSKFLPFVEHRQSRMVGERWGGVVDRGVGT